MKGYDEESLADGQYINAVIETMGEVSPIFEKKTREMFQEVLGDLDSDEWYRLGDVAEAYSRLTDEVGSQTMKQGGEASAKTLPFSDDIGLNEAYDKLDETLKQVYKDSDMEYPGGRYTYDLDTSAGEARLGADKDWALPKPFVKGVHSKMIERFGPNDVSLHFREVEPEGDEQFVWEVTW